MNINGPHIISSNCHAKQSTNSAVVFFEPSEQESARLPVVSEVHDNPYKIFPSHSNWLMVKYLLCQCKILCCTHASPKVNMSI
jgi:hypothetical protein